MTTSAAIGPYVNRLSSHNKAARAAWGVVYKLLFRPSPVLFHAWRRFLLRCFGAQVERGAHVYPRCRIWAPWNLRMGADSCLADFVDCYSVARIELGAHAIVSQYSFLCAATHDYEAETFALRPGPIVIGARAWIASDVFVGPRVTIGDGAVVGARSSVFKDVPRWTVVVGNPARFLKRRIVRDDESRHPGPVAAH